jgi:hypothetical protein
MLYEVRVTNPRGVTEIFDLFNPEKSGFIVKGIEGLGPPKSNVNLKEHSYVSGSTFKSVRTPSRNIVLTLEFLPRTEKGVTSIELTRHRSYEIFPYESLVKIEFVTDTRTSYTWGYVESNEPSIFSQQSGCVVSLICPDPSFRSVDDSVNEAVSASSGMFGFDIRELPALTGFKNDVIDVNNQFVGPNKIVFGEALLTRPEFTIPKDGPFDGTVNTGPTLRITVVEGHIHNPEIHFYNEFDKSVSEHLSFELGSVAFPNLAPKDQLIIDCTKGNKSVIRRVFDEDLGSYDLNYIGAVTLTSSWPVLSQGYNRFSYSASSPDGGSMLFEYAYEKRYSGI